MTRIIPIQSLPALTRDLLNQIAQGDELVVEEAGQPVARFTPLAPGPAVSAVPTTRRESGFWKGQIATSADFDEPMPDSFWLGGD
jgi:antitoxin (DNA-binding transcriptional repressor) of toxin-antitoxin stability system